MELLQKWGGPESRTGNLQSLVLGVGRWAALVMIYFDVSRINAKTGKINSERSFWASRTNNHCSKLSSQCFCMRWTVLQSSRLYSKKHCYHCEHFPITVPLSVPVEDLLQCLQVFFLCFENLAFRKKPKFSTQASQIFALLDHLLLIPACRLATLLFFHLKLRACQL